MEVKTKRAAIYARVSTERQEKEGTIESQLAELREICRKDGVTVVKEYIDNGFSGSTLARPALDQLRDDATKGLFDVVYIHSPDRLARKYVYQALVIEELRKNGVEIKFLNKALTDSPEDQLLLGVQGLIAEYEKAKIIERTRRGRLHKAKMGNIMGGTAPYGYDYVKKTKDKGAYYKVNEDEAEIVRLIFSLYLKHGSTSEVVKELARRKIRNRSGSIYWSKGTVHRILTNECYIGRAYYNKQDKGIGKKRRVRDRSEWIPIDVPKIIDESTFQLVQEMLKFHKPSKRTRVYLLSGLIKCKNCGSNYIGLSSNRRNFYYRCGNFVKRFPLPKNCNAKPVNALRIENAVVNAIKEAITKPEIILGYVRKLSMELAKKTANVMKEKKKIALVLESLRRKKAKLLDLYLNEAITKEEYLNKKEEIELKEKELENKTKELAIAPVINDSLIIKSINYFSELAKDRIDSLTPEEMQRFLKLLVDKIIFDSQKLEAKIIAHIPIIDEKFDEQNLFQFPPALTGSTRNKRIQFELYIKI